MDHDLAIYFDIDGTLVWRETHDDDITGAAREFALEIDDDAIGTYNDLTNQYFQRNTAAPYERGIERWCEHYGFDVDPAAFTEAVKRIQIEDTRKVDGTEAALDALADGATLGVLTNGAGDMQRGKLDRHDLDDYFR